MPQTALQEELALSSSNRTGAREGGQVLRKGGGRKEAVQAIYPGTRHVRHATQRGMASLGH